MTAQVLDFATEKAAILRRGRAAIAVERAVISLMRELADDMSWALEPGGAAAFSALLAERLSSNVDFVASVEAVA